MSTFSGPNFPAYTQEDLYIDAAKRKELLNWLRLNSVITATVEKRVHYLGSCDREAFLEIVAISLAEALFAAYARETELRMQTPLLMIEKTAVSVIAH